MDIKNYPVGPERDKYIGELKGEKPECCMSLKGRCDMGCITPDEDECPSCPSFIFKPYSTDIATTMTLDLWPVFQLYKGLGMATIRLDFGNDGELCYRVCPIKWEKGKPIRSHAEILADLFTGAWLKQKERGIE